MNIGNIYQVEYRQILGTSIAGSVMKVAALNISEAIEAALKINSSEITSVRLVVESVFF